MEILGRLTRLFFERGSGGLPRCLILLLARRHGEYQKHSLYFSPHLADTAASAVWFTSQQAVLLTRNAESWGCTFPYRCITIIDGCGRGGNKQLMIFKSWESRLSIHDKILVGTLVRRPTWESQRVGDLRAYWWLTPKWIATTRTEKLKVQAGSLPLHVSIQFDLMMIIRT